MKKTEKKIVPARKIRGEIKLPGDKSISHRAIIFSSLANGESEIYGLSGCEDCLRTLAAFNKLGVNSSKFKKDSKKISVQGIGIEKFSEAEDVIYLGNSGTSMRLLAGVLSARPLFTVLTGDSSLRSRPMRRIIDPLEKMGARIWGKAEDNYPPLAIRGQNLNPIKYNLPVPSAQVKSAIILAGMNSDGITEVIEPIPSRDHTEIMLEKFGGKIQKNENLISIKGPVKLQPREIIVPGDLSSGSFFIVAASLLGDSKIIIKDVGLNPTRTGIIDILKKMGSKIRISNVKTLGGEIAGDIEISSSELKGIDISGTIVPKAIDEFPILFVAASLAEGETKIRGVEELRFKETDRIKTMCKELKKMGIDIKEQKEGVTICGKKKLKGSRLKSFGDHRVAMALSIAALAADGESIIEDVDCINTSFPGYFEQLESIISR